MEGCRVILRPSELQYARQHYRDHLCLADPNATAKERREAIQDIMRDQTLRGPQVTGGESGYGENSKQHVALGATEPDICPWAGCPEPLPKGTGMNRHLDVHMGHRYRCPNSGLGCPSTFGRSDLPGKHLTKGCKIGKCILPIVKLCRF